MDLSIISKEHFAAAIQELATQSNLTPTPFSVFITETGKELPFKSIVRRAYLLAGGSEEDAVFRNSWHKRNWFTSVTALPVRFSTTEHLPFFTESELEHFSSVAGNVYSRSNPLDVSAGTILREGVVRKTNAWVRSVEVDPYVSRMEHHWQISGHFKTYTWARLFKKQHVNRKVFFTVGVESDNNALVMKLDCQFKNYKSGNALSAEQVRRFKAFVKGLPADWHQITTDQFHLYDWAKLVQETEEFIMHYDDLYEEAIRLVWDQPAVFISRHDKSTTRDTPPRQEESPSVPPPQGLVQTNPPPGIEAFSERRRLTHGTERPDYDAENERKGNIGIAGERLVIAFEKKRLQDAGRHDLAANIIKVPDWKGYDIESFEEDGRSRLIEVKTTPGNVDRHFMMSWHERKVMSEEKDRYYLYRLYEFDAAIDSAKFFILHEHLPHGLIEDPVSFRMAVRSV